MKKNICFALALGMTIGALTFATPIDIYAGASDISVTINKETVDFSEYGAYPKIENNTTYVPLRSVFETIGAKEVKKEVVMGGYSSTDEGIYAFEGTVNGFKIIFMVNIKEKMQPYDSYYLATYEKDGISELESFSTLDLLIENNRTLIPVRGISEAFGYEVGWDNSSRMVTIDTTHPENEMFTLIDRKLILQTLEETETQLEELNINAPSYTVDDKTNDELLELNESLNALIVETEEETDSLENSKPITSPVNSNATYTKLQTIYDHTSYDFDDYTDTYGGLVTENLFYVNDEFIMVSINNSEKKLYIETFDKKYQPLTTKEISSPLDLIGGIHYAEDGNFYVVYGNKNENISATDESLRVVKYDSDFNTLGSYSTSTMESFIKTPFYKGSLRMASDDNLLVITTSRELFSSIYGGTNQANYSLVIDTLNMTSKNIEYGNLRPNTIPNSVNQYVLFDTDDTDDVLNSINTILFLDQGTSYPRGLVFNETDQYINKTTTTTIETIKGSVDTETTNFTVNGFEEDKYTYVTLVSAQYDKTDEILPRNVQVHIIYKNNDDTYNTNVFPITDYDNKNNLEAGNMTLTKLKDNLSVNKYVVMWEEILVDYKNKTKTFVETKYVVINDQGTQLTEIQSLGDMRVTKNLQPVYINPIYNESDIAWYYTDDKGNTFLGRLNIPTY
ncbi:MAG: copper amine oxidase N-terminal domain-containing protein [Lachnospirales bacterium]